MPDVVLVSMPFGPVFSPSIGLSLLKSGLAEHGLSARIHYFSIRFAEGIGQAFYSGIADEGRPALEDQVGEWLFARALFDTIAAEDARYVEELLRGYYSEALIARVLRAHEQVDAFLDHCLDALVREQPRLVGFTSVFQQHVASLALARRLKEALPSTFIVFGGANCEGVMGGETVRSFPFVDAAVSGEADLVFPDIVRRLLEGRPVSGLPGVRARATIDEEFAAGRFSNAPMVREMDRLPYPDYSDYFAQFKASRYDRDWQPSIFLETSRGCWWGERMHCTFCGLNGATMAFRSKSAARALEEVSELVRRHPGCDIQVVDNILDMRYFKDFVPALAARRLKVGFFYETKSNLNKQQVRLLREAGIREIQPGVESLSDSVLKLIRKGVSGLQNVQLLKWCKEFGIEPSWNFLWGFPGEQPEEYARMARTVPLLTHLQPPVSHATIRLDRFSPNFFDAERFGFTEVTPLAAYRHIYRLSDAKVANLACYFTYRYKEPRDVERYVRPLARAVEQWKRLNDRSDVFSVEAGEQLLIVDLRPPVGPPNRLRQGCGGPPGAFAKAAANQPNPQRRRKHHAKAEGGRHEFYPPHPFTLLTGLDRTLYRECDATRDLWQLAHAASAAAGAAMALDDIELRLAPLVERGLLLRDGSRYLALAIPLGEYTPKPAIVRRFSRLVRALGDPRGRQWVLAKEGLMAKKKGGKKKAVKRKVRVGKVKEKKKSGRVRNGIGKVKPKLAGAVEAALAWADTVEHKMSET